MGASDWGSAGEICWGGGGGGGIYVCVTEKEREGRQETERKGVQCMCERHCHWMRNGQWIE